MQDALEAQIASNDYPNIIVNVALSLRTIVAFVPYYVHGAGLPAPLGDILYVATNVPAQMVAFVHRRVRCQALPDPAAATGDHVHPGAGDVDRGRLPHGLWSRQPHRRGLYSRLEPGRPPPCLTWGTDERQQNVSVGLTASFLVREAWQSAVRSHLECAPAGPASYGEPS